MIASQVVCESQAPEVEVHLCQNEWVAVTTESVSRSAGLELLLWRGWEVSVLVSWRCWDVSRGGGSSGCLEGSL